MREYLANGDAIRPQMRAMFPEIQDELPSQFKVTVEVDAASNKSDIKYIMPDGQVFFHVDWLGYSVGELFIRCFDRTLQRIQ